MDSDTKRVLLRIAPLIAASVAHSCTITHTLALTTFLSLSNPTTHSPSLRAWIKPYLFRIGPLLLPAHRISAICLGINVWSTFKINADLDAQSRKLYIVALTLEIVSMSLVWVKWKAVKMATEGSDNERTLEGVRAIGRVSWWRMALVDLVGWGCIFWGTVRALR